MFVEGYNLIVDAVAGSGKTYTILLICLRLLELFPKKKCLIITYNKELKEEVRLKINKYKLKNVDMHNYHAIGVNYYKKPKGFPDDEFLDNIITEDINNTKTINYDYIFIDEMQDCTLLYFKLIQKVLNDNICKDPTIAVFGDIHQTLYSFKGSDRRFLTLADLLFRTDRKWKKLKLSQSFRVTKPIANFVNHVLLNEERIISNKESTNKVDYIICDLFNKSYEIVNIIQKYIIDKVYKKDEIFILVNAIPKSKPNVKMSPFQKISNLLSSKNFQVATAMNDNEIISKNVKKNKVSEQTISSSKGLESKLVVTIGFDNGFFIAGNNRKSRKDICPDPLYVACTRASEKLIVVHGSSNDYLPFIHKNHLDDLHQYVNVIEISSIKIKSIFVKDTNCVTDLCRYLSIKDTKKARKYVKYKCIQSKSNIINIPHEIETSKGYESVSDISGIAIPMWYEFITDKTCTNLKYICNQEYSKIKQIFFKNVDKVINYRQSIDLTNFQFSDCLRLATLYQSLKSQFGHKFNQIDQDRYDWIDNYTVDIIIKRMSKHINKDSEYERLINGKMADCNPITGRSGYN